MVQVYESENGLSLSCFMPLMFARILRSGRKQRDRAVPVRLSQRREIFHSRDDKIPHAGQWRFLTQLARWESRTKSATCSGLAPLARRLQIAFAWLNPCR